MIRPLIATAVIFLLIGLGAGVGLTLAVTSDDALAPTVVARPILEPKPYTLPLKYAETVIYYCDSTGVPVWMACRLFEYESGWKESKVNVNFDGTTDVGIAQINSRYSEELRRSFGYEEAPDIGIGIRYLAALKERYGSWREAVKRYAGRRSEAGIKWIMGED